jgi:hypothetical protein
MVRTVQFEPAWPTSEYVWVIATHTGAYNRPCAPKYSRRDFRVASITPLEVHEGSFGLNVRVTSRICCL